MKIVKETRVGGRTVAQFGLGEEFEHRSGKQVRCGVAHHLERLRICFFHQLQLRVRSQRCSQVNQARCPRVLGAIHGGLRGVFVSGRKLFCAAERCQPRHHGGRSQPWRD